MSASSPYVILRWRRPVALFAPLGLAVAALSPGGALAIGLPHAAPLALAVSGCLGGILCTALLLCRRRDRTMPILLATTLSVTHATLFVAAIVALGLPAAAEGLQDLAAEVGAWEVAHSASAAVLAAYLAAFFGLTALAGLGLLALRYLAMTRRAA